MSFELNRDLFENLLLNWYDLNYRVLPWRIPPNFKNANLLIDPYKIWISEIMLQQTGVETVKPYFEKFIQIWPDIYKLSQSDLTDVLRIWSGLGYYGRARNLKKCAVKIVNEFNGIFPQDYSLLLSLPGIGPYTAGALMTIAFNKTAPVADGNIVRIFSRLFKILDPTSKSKPYVFKKVYQYLSSTRPGDYVQALMDLGSLICIPSTPKCHQCPLTVLCGAYKTNESHRFPVPHKKIKKRIRYGYGLILISPDLKVALKPCTEKNLLNGLWEIPYQYGDLPSDLKPPFLKIENNWTKCALIKHEFSHFKLYLDIYVAHFLNQKLINTLEEWNLTWHPINRLKDIPMSILIKKAINGYLKTSMKPTL